MKGKISYRIYEGVSFALLTQQFTNLLHPLFLKKFNHQIKQNNFVAVLASVNDDPVALTITELKSNHTAELHSVMVKKEFQNMGIASQMLMANDQFLKKKKIQHIDVAWYNALKHSKEFGMLLKKLDWLPPQRRSLNIKININNAEKAYWVYHALNTFEKDTEIVDWADINNQDKQELISIQNTPGFPTYLTPFQVTGIVDSKVSKLLRVKGKAVGWIIFHKIKSDTLQCSALFVSKRYRSKERTLRLIANSVLDMNKTNILYCTYQTIYADKLVSRFLSRLFSKNDAIVMRYHTLASRKYYNKSVNHKKECHEKEISIQ